VLFAMRFRGAILGGMLLTTAVGLAVASSGTRGS